MKYYVAWRKAGRNAKWHVPDRPVTYDRAVTDAEEHMRAGRGVTIVSDTFPELVDELRRFAGNPGELLTFGTNPDHGTPGAKKLGRIVAVRYLHETEGPREHRFHEDEHIELLRDGSFRVYHPDGARLWKNLK